MRILILALFLMGIVGPTNAQQSRYSTWGNPDNRATGSEKNADSQRLNEFIGKLNKLVDDAEKARAADPIFLRDLKELARAYGSYPQQKLISEQFTDNEYTTNPTWTVKSGRFWVDKGWGLRSVVEPQDVNAQSNPQSTQGGNGGDVAAQIFGQILNQALGGSTQQATPQRQPTTTNYAVISTAVVIPQAFEILFEFSSWQAKGRLLIGPLLAGYPDAGYRLAYTPGGKYQLLRITEKDSTVIGSVESGPTLEDRRKHNFLWSRTSDGQMKISIDGKLIIDSMDQTLGRSFAGFQLVNQGGDYIVSNITVSGI
jgi:hypothetical protein